MDWVGKPQNYKDLYGILQLLRGSHLQNFQLKTHKLGWVTFHSITFQLKCLDFQSNQYKKLVPVLSRFCNCLFLAIITQRTFFTPYLSHSPSPPKKNNHKIKTRLDLWKKTSHTPYYTLVITQLLAFVGQITCIWACWGTLYLIMDYLSWRYSYCEGGRWTLTLPPFLQSFVYFN